MTPEDTTPTDERSAFEAWAKANGFGNSQPATWAWQAWQARASLAPSPAPSQPAPAPLRRGISGVCSRSYCICERDGLGDQCVWLNPNDAELERRTGEPHISGWPLYSGLPPPAAPVAQATPDQTKG